MLPTLYSLLLAALLQPAPKTGFVEGTVADATTGAPLAQASVNVRYESAPDGSGRLSSLNERGNTAETGVDGRFRLEVAGGVPFHFAVKRQGYTTIGEQFGHRDPNPHTVEAGKEKTGVVVRMSPESSLAGSVFDPDLKKPVEGVTIRAMKRIQEEGAEYWAPRGQAQTGADGRYVIGGLPAGEYKLFLAPGLVPKLVPAPEKPSPPVLDYLMQYYPGVTDERSALAVQLLPGASLDSLDFRVTRQRLFSIRGEVLMDGPPEQITMFAIQPFGEDGGVHRAVGTLPAPGAFELRNLPPGPVKLAAANFKSELPRRRLALLDTSMDADIADARLQLLPATQATFAISTFGLREDQKDPLWTELKAQCSVQLSPLARTSWGGNEAARAGAGGRGTLENVFIEPVRVMVQGIPEGWILRETHYNGQPVEAYRVDLNPAAPAHHLRLLLAPAPNSIGGAVRDGNSPAAGALVVASREPFDKDTVHLRQKRATADANGHYTMRALAPGVWRVVAVPAGASWQAARRLLLAGTGEKADVPESGVLSLQLDARR